MKTKAQSQPSAATADSNLDTNNVNVTNVAGFNTHNGLKKNKRHPYSLVAVMHIFVLRLYLVCTQTQPPPP